MRKNLTNDLMALVGPKLDNIRGNDFLEEWWDATTTFLTLAYKTIHINPGHSKAGFVRKRLKLWCLAVESVRQCYYLAHGCFEIVTSAIHRGIFANDVRNGEVARWRPFRPFEAELALPQQRDNGDIDALRSKLSQYTQQLLEDVQKPTDPWQDIKLAYDVLKNIDAYVKISGIVPQLDHAELAENALEKWAQAKDSGVYQYVDECNQRLQHLGYKDSSLEAIEGYFEHLALLVERLTFIGDYFLSKPAMKNFEITVRAYLMEFRDVGYTGYSEISRIWFTIWKILDKLCSEDLPGGEEVEQLSPHKALDFRFLRLETQGFEGIRKKQLLSRRAMHLLIGHYCDTVIAAMQTTLYDSGDRSLEIQLTVSDMFDNFLQPSEEEGNVLPDTNEDFHIRLHQLTLRLVSLCRKEGFRISAAGYHRGKERAPNISKNSIKLPDLPLDLLKEAFTALRIDRYGSAPTPSDDISSSPPHIFSSPERVSSRGTSPPSQHTDSVVEKTAEPTIAGKLSEANVQTKSPPFRDHVIKTGQPSQAIAQTEDSTVRNKPYIYNAPNVVAKPAIRAPYMRLIPGNGQYLMGETAAVSRAIGQQIARDLVEPGLDGSTDPIEVNCKVQPPFHLPGINHPAGLYDATKSSSESKFFVSLYWSGLS